MSETTRTQVVIVGAGPAGLMISQMLANRGVDSVAIDIRTREEIENTHRAGILEAQAIKMMDAENVSDRYKTDGYEHDGTIIRVNGVSHRINFKELVGESVWLYPQTDVFIDLANARQKAQGDVRFGVSDVEVVDPYSDNPGVKFVDADGNAQEVRGDFLVGSDGSRSICRFLIPEEGRTQFFREYPFAWFGIMAEAPMSADELIYATNERGFALISQRTESIQRMYLQCNPSDDMYQWSEDQLWEGIPVPSRGLRRVPAQDRQDFRAYAPAVPLVRAGADAARSYRARRRCRPHRAPDRRPWPQPGAVGCPGSR